MRPGALGLYEEALRAPGVPLLLRSTRGHAVPLHVARWCDVPDAADESVLRRCRGPVLDVGCGPGRLTLALAARGVPALGVDISPTAVARVRRAGGCALRRSVFDVLPGDGRWSTALLIDGNIGIGGAPDALLRRCASLLAPEGLLLVEAERDDVDERLTAWLEHADGRRGPRFRWAMLGISALRSLAETIGLRVVEIWHHDGRAFLAATRSDHDSGACQRSMICPSPIAEAMNELTSHQFTIDHVPQSE
jgi:SAM-dependent methyltransferase